MSNNLEIPETGCGECISCTSGYNPDYCITNNPNKTDTLPAVHHNDEEPLSFEH